MQHHDEKKIDIVIAWVDGASPALKLKREQYKKTANTASDAVTATRFASNDEIYYNIASIIKYVPFCRYIYIVTDQQQPNFIHEFSSQHICSVDKIRIVDHKDIFAGYEEYLPTFNSLSIETMLWNIAGLSEYFIYMNDDFFFNQPATIADFLDGDNIIIHGHWRKKLVLNAKLKYREMLNKLFNVTIQPKYTIAQMLGAKPIQNNQFFEIHHYPHIIDKNNIKNYLLDNHDLLKHQIKYKFRDISQFDPVSLINHLKIQKNQAILQADISINYLKNEHGIEDFIANLDNKSIKYGCIQSMDLLSESALLNINSALMQKFSSHLPQTLLNHIH